ILIIVAVSSIGFMYLGNSENNHNITPTTPTPVSSEIKIPVGNQIENWKTYRNDEYGFEFQYPGDWFHEKLEYSSSHINSIFTDHYGFGFIDNKNHIGEEITPFINSRVLIHTANTNNSNIVDDITKNDFNKFTSMNPDISKRQI